MTMDTITIDGVVYGPAIPHDPSPVTLSDEAAVNPVCPFPDAVGIVKWSDSNWDEFFPASLFFWDWQRNDENIHITAYRLPANHHAYGPRKSRMGREPDYGVAAKVGIWRVYLKERVA